MSAELFAPLLEDVDGIAGRGGRDGGPGTVGAASAGHDFDASGDVGGERATGEIDRALVAGHDDDTSIDLSADPGQFLGAELGVAFPGVLGPLLVAAL